MAKLRSNAKSIKESCTLEPIQEQWIKHGRSSFEHKSLKESCTLETILHKMHHRFAKKIHLLKKKPFVQRHHSEPQAENDLMY